MSWEERHLRSAPLPLRALFSGTREIREVGDLVEVRGLGAVEEQLAGFVVPERAVGEGRLAGTSRPSRDVRVADGAGKGRRGLGPRKPALRPFPRRVEAFPVVPRPRGGAAPPPHPVGTGGRREGAGAPGMPAADARRAQGARGNLAASNLRPPGL